MGYNTPELDLIIGGVPEEDDALPENAEMPDRDQPSVTKVGDLRILGQHRLYCGNSLEPQSYKQLLTDDAVRMEPAEYLGNAQDGQMHVVSPIRGSACTARWTSPKTCKAFTRCRDASLSTSTLKVPRLGSAHYCKYLCQTTLPSMFERAGLDDVDKAAITAYLLKHASDADK